MEQNQQKIEFDQAGSGTTKPGSKNREEIKGQQNNSSGQRLDKEEESYAKLRIEDLEEQQPQETDDDQQYFIKDLDSGKTIDMRTGQYVEVENYTVLQLEDSQSIWTNHWKTLNKMKEEMLDSVQLGNLQDLQKIMEGRYQGEAMDINYRSMDNWTALHHAANEGYYHIVDYILKIKGEVNAKTSFDRIPLHISCIRGLFEISKLLIEYGADINAQDKDFCTPLHYASMYGHGLIVKFFLERLPNLEIRNYQGMTAIDASNNYEILKIFQDSGLANVRKIYSRTAIEGSILKNSRTDHVERLLYLTNRNMKLPPQSPANPLANSKMKTSSDQPGSLQDSSSGGGSPTKQIGGTTNSNSKPKQLNASDEKSTASTRVDTEVDTKLSSSPKTSNGKTNLNGKLSSKLSSNEEDQSAAENRKMDSKKKSSGNELTQEEIARKKTHRFQNGKISKVKIEDFDNGDQSGIIGPDDFIILDTLGKGAFGHVYLVKQKDNKNLYAMKTLSKERVLAKNLVKYAMAQRNILSVMDHPFVVSLNYAFQTGNKLYLVMRYCPGGDLQSQLFKQGRIAEDVVRIYISEILLALEALHSACIIFRDLKPSNVVLDEEGHACLTDFGLSKPGLQNTIKATSFCGSLAYLAPEMIEKTGHGFSIDWYLLGVLMYELLDGFPPFYDDDKATLLNNIKTGDLKPPQKASQEAISLIKALLQKNPDKRLGAKGGADEIQAHPWFKSLDWNEVYNRKLKPPPPPKRQKDYNDEFPDDFKITFTTNQQLLKDGNKKDFIQNWSFIHKPNGGVGAAPGVGVAGGGGGFEQSSKNKN